VPSIIDLLVKIQILDERQHDAVESRSRSPAGGHIVQQVAEMGYATEGTVARAISVELGLPRIDLAMTPPEPAALALLDARTCADRFVLPIALRESGELLWLAMADPTDQEAIGVVRRKAQKRVRAVDVIAEGHAPVAAEGAEAAASVAEGLKDYGMVVTMLPAGELVRAVCLGEGVLAQAMKGALLIDCSTIVIDSARSVHAAAARAGIVATLAWRLAMVIVSFAAFFLLGLPALLALVVAGSLWGMQAGFGDTAPLQPWLAGAGGMGRLVAEWIVEGRPALDAWEMDSRRFGRHHSSREYTLERTREVYSTYYDVQYPGHERSAGRPLRLSPIYPRLAELGAAFGEKSGWERVNWFEPNGSKGDQSLRPHGWAGRLWSPAIGAEHMGCRTSAAVFDFTSFAKFEVRGLGAADFLEGLCDNRVARAVGALTYTQMLNGAGGIECDFTVTRLAEDRFRIVTGTAFGQHDLFWVRDHAPSGGSVQVEEVTSAYACVGLWGPSARAILQPLTTTDVGHAAFPFMTAQSLAVGSVPCLALRVTYVGELGWELYCPAEFGLRLWDTIWESGKGHGLVGGGYKAVDSLRLEKGYRVWGSDISPDSDPYQAGLGFCVKLDKGEFVGRRALLAKRDAPAPTKLACLVLDDPQSVVLGSEPVRIDGEVVGRVTSGGYGYAVERSIAYAYIPAATPAGTRIEVDIFGTWVAGHVAPEPLYDPAGARIRS